MKTTTVISLFAFFFSVFAVRGQTDISALQFPYFDIQLSNKNQEFVPSYFLPCPYAEIWRENHIQSVKLYGDFESDLQYIGYYFDRNGRTDSIVYSYPTALGHYRKEFRSRYLFHYNKEGQIDRVNCLYDDYLVSQCGILYDNGIVKETRQIIFEDTVYTRYIVAPDSSSVKIVFSGNSTFSDTIFAADPVLEEVWIFPDEYFLSKKGKSQVFALKDRKAEQKHYSILKNKNGKTTSISMFDLWPEYQEPVWYSIFKWSETGILSCIAQANYISPNNYNNTECFTNNNVIYKCFFNEEYLPDSIFGDEKITAVEYEYFDDIFRWSPCGFRDKWLIDYYVENRDKLKLNSDTIDKRNNSVLYNYCGEIMKMTEKGNTYWFSNDYLIKAALENGETYWFRKDSLVAFVKTGANRRIDTAKIAEQARIIMEEISVKMREIQPGFGVRIVLLGQDSESNPWLDGSRTSFHFSRSQLDSLKWIETNSADFKVSSFCFDHACIKLPAEEFITYYKGNEIPVEIRQYFKNPDIRFPEFFKIEISNAKGQKRILGRVIIFICDE